MPKVVIVTGASNGIGRAIAKRLIQDDYFVLNLDRSPPSALLGNEEYVNIDLSDTDALAACLKQLTSQYQILRVVNNAAIVCPGSMLDTSLENMRAVASVNLEAPLVIAHHVVPEMQRQGFGRIVNICSRVVLGKQHRTAYAASKGGLLSMTRTWALELAPHGITVNAVGPGPIATELFMAANPADAPKTKRILDSVPVQRIGKPEEIAHAAAYFMHDLGGFTTGQILYVCGGMTVGLGM